MYINCDIAGDTPDHTKVSIRSQRHFPDLFSIVMSLEYAILSTLLASPCSGYDLAKQFDGSLGFFWKARHQQIYRALNKLETQGWLAAETIPQQGKPSKNIYALTTEGRAGLQVWLQHPCEPPMLKNELLVKLFAGELLSRDCAIAALTRHRQRHCDRLTTYELIEQQDYPDVAHLSLAQRMKYLTLRNGIRYERDRVAWCDEAIALLSATPDASRDP